MIVLDELHADLSAARAEAAAKVHHQHATAAEHPAAR
jgi:hypothetical protein